MLKSVPRSHWLTSEAIDRLEHRIVVARRDARHTKRSTLVSVTMPTRELIDPSAVVAGSRRSGGSWFCLEQSDRAGFALAGLGAARVLEASGEDRCFELARRWREIAGDAACDDPGDAPGAGLVAVGGFAFAASGATSHHWRGFAPASLIVPEVSLARSGGASWLTLTINVGRDDSEVVLHRRVSAILESLRAVPLPLMDPAPVGSYEVVSPLLPAHYEAAVARAAERIAQGAFAKVVLAREVDVYAPVDYEPAAVFGVLRDAYSSSFSYLVGRGDATFLGATPELLVRREGQRASTVALAGSTRRSADPAVDEHLAEQLLRSGKDREENAIVAARIIRQLRPLSVWVSAAEEPAVVKVANIQHLASPIRAQLAKPVDALELVARLHPTPAVGAEPQDAVSEIPGLEGFDRGWYAGAVGWTDAAGDGEFCVALRGGLLRGAHARCYAGCGIVAASDPASELAETEIKLGVILPLLTG